MFKGIPKELSYSSWLSTAKHLSPAYDYVDFANFLSSTKENTNRSYSNIMRKALHNAEGEEKTKIADVINTFNSRSNPTSTFGQQYTTYWSERDKNDTDERMSKRQRIAAEKTNEAACSSFEKIVSKIAQTASGVANSPVTANAEANNQRSDEVDDDLKELENVVYKEFKEKIIYLDQKEYKQSRNDNKIVSFLSNITDIPSKELSNDCQHLLQKISDCVASSKIIRSAIRSHALTMEEPFDLVLHDDLNFTEIICTHFLNLIDSPRNPLQQQQLERNTAFLTTIPILHNLFIAYNDIIDMQWVEKQTKESGNTKWDGIAFLVKNKKITPLFVELSGGIHFNSGANKEKDDEGKLIKHFIKTLKVKKAEGIEMPSQFYIRYHDLNIYFESLTYYEDYFIKRTYIILTCPSTPTELKQFVEKIPQILQYRQGILNQLTTN